MGDEVMLAWCRFVHCCCCSLPDPSTHFGAECCRLLKCQLGSGKEGTPDSAEGVWSLLHCQSADMSDFLDLAIAAMTSVFYYVMCSLVLSKLFCRNMPTRYYP